MGFFAKLMPEFWSRADRESTGHRMLFNYRRMWWQTVLVTSVVCLLPLCVMTLINYFEYQRTLKNELLGPMDRLVSNTSRAITFFLEERKSALQFVVRDRPFEDLSQVQNLTPTLVNLKKAFGGFVDLGIITSDGVQRVYSGPYRLQGKNYQDQDWYKETILRGVYISKVFRGFRDYPHFVIAIKHERPDGDFFVLRATIDAATLQDLTRHPGGGADSSDSFIVSDEGTLETASWHYGNVLEQFWYPIPAEDQGTRIVETTDPLGHHVLLGYRHIPESPFVFVLVRVTPRMSAGWLSLRKSLIGFFAGSVVVILIVIMAVCTYLVTLIHEADRRREALLHKAEYTNKLASLGRLAAGVAHEINNPLAIINEKAGLMKDMVAMVPDFPNKEKALDITDAILHSVDRCSTITHRLLGFARHIDVHTETLYLDALVREVLGFMGKESEYRSITVDLDVEGEIPPIESDRGQLQQVFLNIINNAFAAVEDGGRVGIRLYLADKNTVAVRIEDNGCGIERENVKLIFEPFFSTKGRKGTGLGLSITYGIIRKLGGNIEVESEPGQGTSFTVTLPIRKVS